MGVHVNILRVAPDMSGCARLCVSRRLETSDTTPNQVVLDDFAIAQSTPLPERIAGIEGDKV